MANIRRLILAFVLSCGLAPAFAQAPAPVPALPDTERRQSYSISGTTCACAINFQLYGDGTDFSNWVEVFLNGTRVAFNDSTFGWTITTPSGSFASLARPVSNAVLTFNSAQTGTVQIVGARRPRRLSTFAENVGVPARSLNQILNDMTAQTRELWDKTNSVTGRAILGVPGETISPLPSAAARASSFICWDATGLIPMACAPLNGQGNVVGPNSAIDGHIAVYSGTTGRLIRDGGLIGVGNVTGPGSSTDSAFALFNGTTGAIIKNGPTIIPLASGGTAAALTASNGGLVYSTGAALAILSGTATANQIPMSGASAAPTWSTATYPATTTINQLLWSSGANAIAGLATANNGVLVTSAGGVPSISATLPAAVQGNITALGTIATGVWNGTAIAVANGGTGGTAASGTLLDNITGFATTGYLKRTGAGTYVLNNPIPLADGGSNASLTASNGGMVYSTGTAMAILTGTGTPGQIPLSGANAAPSWSTTTWPSTVTTNSLLYASGSNAISGLASGNNGTLITSGAGIPSISSTLPTAVQSNITQLGTIGAGVWNGTALTGTFIATNTVSNSNLAQAIGPTLKGNPTASTANVQDFTIQGLVNKPIPNANNDYLPIYDATTGTIKSVTPGQLVSGTTAGVSSLNGLTGGLSVVAGAGVNVTAGGSSVTVAAAVPHPGGRLTLTSGTPVMTATASAQTTLYYASYVSNVVPYFTGTVDAIDTIPSNQVSTAMQAASTGALNIAGVFDVWWEGNTNHNICVATNGSGGGWPSDTGASNTARGTGYTQLDRTTRPYITNKNALTNCYNGSTNYGSIAANKATYLGSIYTSAAGQVTYQFGTSASGGGAGMFGVWNMYNRVNVKTTVEDTFTSATVTFGSIVAFNAAGVGSGLNNRVSYVQGLAEDTVSANAFGTGNAGASAFIVMALGHDSTSVITGINTVSANTLVGALAAGASVNTDVGFHFFQALQTASTANGTIYGAGFGLNVHSGITVEARF